MGIDDIDGFAKQVEDEVSDRAGNLSDYKKKGYMQKKLMLRRCGCGVGLVVQFKKLGGQNVLGYDKHSRPLIFMHPARKETPSTEVGLKHIVSTIVYSGGDGFADPFGLTRD